MKLLTKTVLFVCYGNICRSPMAKCYLESMLSKRNVKMQVLTAGLNAVRTHALHKEVTDILEREDLNISDHSSTQLTKELIEKADLISTMEKGHKDLARTR